MRLHHLQITAFGPFPGTVEVDFDDLGATGLFLLTGPTGAGKTSVLDAVCFALYGEVPGDRQQARHLRSDHAPDGAVPEVVLTASIGGRTFRFTRSPAWERPKRRGSGTTRQQPRVLVEERVGGAWTGLVTRLDDAGLLVGSLLGMTCTQFTQVAMLPQGRFQAFLRASSTERHALLQRLFRTDRFERVEQWLAEHRQTVRRHSESLGSVVAGRLHRLQEAANASVPPHWDLDDLAGPAAGGEIDAWAATVERDARMAFAQAAVLHDTALADLEAAQHAVEDARATVARRAAGEAAQAALEALAAEAGTAEEAARRAAAHRRAVEAAPAVRAALDAAAERADAQARLAHLDDALRARDVPLDDEALVEAIRAAELHESELRAALPRVRTLVRQRAELSAAAAASAREREALAEATALAGELPQQLAGLEADERAAWLAAADEAAAAEAVTSAEAGISAALEATRLATEVEEGRTALLAAAEEAQARREAYLDAREERIGAIASELAGALVSGCSCPVCGSVDHPAPATVSAATPRDLEEASRRVYEDAETARMALHEAQTGRVARYEALLSAAGGRSVEEWRSRHADALRRAATASEAQARAGDLARDRRALTARCDAATTEIRRLEVAVARSEERVAQLEEAVTTSARDLDRLELPSTDPDGAVEHAVAALDLATQRAARLRDLHEARTQLRILERAAAAAACRAQEATSAAGFAETADVLAAVLDPAEVEAIAAQLQERSDRDRAARATLADPDVLAALAARREDLDRLGAAAAAAAATRDRAAAALAQSERARARTVRLSSEVRDALGAWAPAREAATTAAALVAFVEGKGADNPLRMRLSAYVLAERLRQVVAAANARLAAMSGQRYTVEQADERGAGDRRGGLSLRVRDEWTGALRDPVTLSGGETFVVSLALALGLADTVSQEAGGTDIDTLFVDEGFGSLDVDTLEEVMDTLDALREGGRTVGVVSHVPEMRERITARLEVCKSRAGSTLRRA